MPLLETTGAASAKGFGLLSSVAAPVYIEDVMSVFLYTGNGSTQTITNGIDLAGKGGLVWIKMRSVAGYEHILTDTARGAQLFLSSDNTLAQQTGTNDLTAFTSTGFSLGSSSRVNRSVVSENQFVSWTFRKQAKFFDVVTYTGNGAARTIAHSLGSAPGMIVIKRTDAVTNWPVWHRSGTQLNSYCAFLNLTAVYGDQGTEIWGSGTGGVPSMTSSTFSLGSDSNVNFNTGTYVAYLFAHDAGGFGLTGTDNVISCGSYTGTGGSLSVSLGWEPQFLLVKRAIGAAADWSIQDTMRGFPVTGEDQRLVPNTSAAEVTSGAGFLFPTATGFGSSASSSVANNSGDTYIYIAIRRGPMKTPTTGTSVYNAIARTGTGAAATVSGVGFAPDAVLFKARNSASLSYYFGDKLRGTSPYLATSDTAAETTSTIVITGYGNNSISVSTSGIINGVQDYINYFFQRAPGFFDEVCYTGTGSNTTQTHNLGVVPEMMFIKGRTGTSSTNNWAVYHSALGNQGFLSLNTTNADGGPAATIWNSTTPTASVFSLGTSAGVNGSSTTYVAYLFATCPGVSKVGSYTGTGNTLQINCGFTGGARFVLIKRTNSAGDWYVWDSARGIVAGNDPYLLLNSTAAEVTSTDYVDTYSAGFEISSTAPAAINANGGSFIFLAIA